MTMFAIILLASLAHGMTIEGFVLGVFAPLLPVLMLGIRQCSENQEAARRLEELRAHIEKLWTDALTGAPSHLITCRSRIIQDEIFENRRKSPLILDRIFAYFREENERLMNLGAAHYVVEARRELNL
jgi:hypothetical protein